MDDGCVAFCWRDYRYGGSTKVITLNADEFIRRFLLHTLPDGFHRIRHYGFLANGHRAARLDLCRKLLSEPQQEKSVAVAAEPLNLLACRASFGFTSHPVVIDNGPWLFDSFTRPTFISILHCARWRCATAISPS